LINKPHSTAAQLEEVIKNDQSLTAKILAAANSAFYGFSQKITLQTSYLNIVGRSMEEQK